MMWLLRKVEPNELQGLFLADVQKKRGQSKRPGRIDGPGEIAIDGHKIQRGDKTRRSELLNTKSKNKMGQ